MLIDEDVEQFGLFMSPIILEFLGQSNLRGHDGFGM
jgi:hypothetical protein